MPTVITRLFSTKADAAQLVDALKDRGFRDAVIDIVEQPAPVRAAPAPTPPAAAGDEGDGVAPPAPVPAPAAGPEPFSVDDLIEKLRAAGVYKTASEKYAKKMFAGGTVVVVRPPYGQAENAGKVVARFRSVDAGVQYEEHAYEDKRLFSNIIRVSGTKSVTRKRAAPRRQPIASRTPLSSRFGWDTIQKPKKRAVGLPNETVSSKIGWNAVSAAPKHFGAQPHNILNYSSFFGLPTILRKDGSKR
ncbi:MAG: hypothetical protein AAGC56_01605 [Pseudomonadota bacterium]